MLKFISTRKNTVDDVTATMATVRRVIEAAMDGEDTIDGMPVEDYIKKQEEKNGILIRRVNNEQREKEEKS